MITNIDVETLDQWLKSGEAVLIDVREKDEFASGHIQGAVSLPLSIFPVTYNHDNYPKGKKLVFQCKAGGRSMNACNIVKQMTATEDEVYNLAGGIGAWMARGKPVTR
ncbi:MAG TPA: rhodanese-like domain-containing protein [Alphaproteobacteria bacterium]|nr:rhodanese-like domain-containing protein [Alphaproteobacteria bacterium]